MSSMDLQARIRELEQELEELRANLPVGPQRFTYGLHDDYEGGEMRWFLEEKQGIVLSEDAWENLWQSRPFYEIILECEVDKDGNVTILGIEDA